MGGTNFASHVKKSACADVATHLVFQHGQFTYVQFSCDR